MDADTRSTADLIAIIELALDNQGDNPTLARQRKDGKEALEVLKRRLKPEQLVLFEV